MTTLSRTWLRRALMVVGSVAAWLLYAVGLIAPLTPSEGPPSAGATAAFLLAPAAALGLVAWGARGRAARALAAAQLALLLASALWLLPPSYRAPARRAAVRAPAI